MKNVLKLNNHNILSFLGRACHKRQQHHKKALRAQVQCQRRRDLCLRNVVFTTFKSIFFKKVQCTSFLNSFYFVPNRVLQSICLRTMSNTLVLFFNVQFFNVAKIKTSWSLTKVFIYVFGSTGFWALIYSWDINTVCTYTVSSDPTVAGSVFIQRFRLFLGQRWAAIFTL